MSSKPSARSGKAKTPPSAKTARGSAAGSASRDPMMAVALESANKTMIVQRTRISELMKECELRRMMLERQEADTLEIISSLRRDNKDKDEVRREVQERLEADIRQLKSEASARTVAHERQVQELRDGLAEKEAQVQTMQQELVEIKDFRRKRQEMLKDLDIQKAEVLDLERRHKESISRMEKKFLEEKLRLQRDANQKISELTLKAHREAVSNLDDTTKSVYRENLRMVEALKHHVQLGDELERQNKALAANNRKLGDEKEMHDVIIREKIVRSKYHDIEVRALQEKVVTMEHSLTHIVQEFEREREILASMTRTELDDMRSVASVLRENLRKKTSEMKYIRRLAFHIIRQRTDLERFFMDALEYVRMELKMEAERKKKERIEAIFINRDHDGGGATRTGGTSSKPLTAESTDVDVRELGWQDKERILRLLFAKMNGVIPDNTAEAMPANQQSALAKEEETIVEAMFAPSISEEQVDAATRKHQVLTREALAAHTQ